MPLAEDTACQDIPLAGRLAYFHQNWEVITKDPWLLQTVSGYKLDFVQPLYQNGSPRQLHFSNTEKSCLQEEIQNMLRKQAISESPRHQSEEGFHSQLFLVPKKDGGQRPIINLKRLNAFVKTEHFKMEGIHMLKDLLKPGDWMAKVNMKDAYFMIPIATEDQKFLRFIPIQLSSIRSVLRPMGLYQDHEASSGPTQRARPQTDHIHRRHPAYGRVGDPTPRPHDGVNLPPREPRVCHQFEEISAHSNERVRVPRVRSELPFHGDEASRREAEENQIGSQAAPFREPSDSPNAFVISGQIECSHQCHSSGSTFLPKPPRSARSGRAELLSECRPHTGSSGGASMVGGASNQVE